MIHRSHFMQSMQLLLIAFRRYTIMNSAVKNFPSVENLLSDSSRKECIERLKNIKLLQRELNETNKTRAAVLIPLCLVKEELSLLYTLRKADLKRHRGQVSFPGGMEDAADATLEHTALRETEEELNIPKEVVKVWGSGCIYTGKEFSVLPVVGFLGHIDVKKLNPNPDEVDVVFTIPLKFFCNPANCRSTQFRYQNQSYILPVYINADYRVWGITALITHIFLASLLPKHYKHKLHLIKPVNSSQTISI